MRGFRVIAVALLAPLLLAMPVSVRAQTGQAIGVGVSPPQTEKDLTGRSFSTTLTVSNDDPVKYDISLSLQALGHDLDGAPQYLPSTVVTNAVSLSATKFSLTKGQRKQVKVSGSIPKPSPSIYFGVVAEFKRADQETGQSVETRTRVAAEFLLRAPKPWVERVKVTDVGAIPGPGKKVTLYAIVKNTGNVHVRPRGTVTVAQAGNTVAAFPFQLNASGKPGAIIPRFSRRLTALWTPPSELTGTYTVTATIAGPVAKGSKSVEFSMGEALAPNAKIANLSATDQGGLNVDSDIRNSGGAALNGAKLTLVARQDGQFERGRKVIVIDRLGPGKTVQKTWNFGAQPDGAYQITATLEQGTTLLDQRVAGVRLGAAPAKAGRSVLIIIAAILLALIVGLVIWFLLKRRQRDGDAAARAA
jgi:hypothetical protein